MEQFWRRRKFLGSLIDSLPVGLLVQKPLLGMGMRQIPIHLVMFTPIKKVESKGFMLIIVPGHKTSFTPLHTRVNLDLL